MSLLVGLVTAPSALASSVPTATLTVNDWQADTASGRVTYDVTATAEGPCLGGGCSISLETGSGPTEAYRANGSASPASSSAVWDGGNWRGSATFTADRQVLPETLAIRAKTTDSQGTVSFSPWQQVSDPYPTEVLTLAGATSWKADTSTGHVDYDLTVSGAGLARAGGPCETTYCSINVQAGRLAADGTFQPVTTLNCPSGWLGYNLWTFSVKCTATNSGLPEVTHIRAQLTNYNGKTLATAVQQVSDPYPDATMQLTVKKWDDTGEQAVYNSGFVDYDIAATAGGLAGAGGLCETHACSIAFQGGMPGSDGVIHAHSRIAADGQANLPAGTWTASITSGGDHVGVVDQLYLRTALYSDGYLAYVTPWQERSSLPYSASDGGAQLGLVGAGISAALSKGLVQDPCVEFLPMAPGVDKSPSEPQSLCLEAQGLGTTWARTMGALPRPAVQSISAALAALGVVVLTATPVTDLDEEPEFLADVQAIVSRTRVRSSNYDLSGSERRQAATIVRYCRLKSLEGSVTAQDCRTMPIFAPGSDVMDATVHDWEAIQGHPSWTKLSYISDADQQNVQGISHGGFLRRVTPACPSPRPGGADGAPTQCDEYPFWSAAEGGPSNSPSLKLISAFDNQKEGALLGQFYNVCGLTNSPAGSRPYLVLPVSAEPLAVPVPTAAWCGR